MHTRTWHVTVDLFEHDTLTRATAVLRTDAGPELRRDVPEIGAELATCRALSGLAHDLLDAAIADVAANDPDAGEPHISADSPDIS